MKRIIVLVGIGIVSAILFACAPKAMPEAPEGKKSSEIAAPVIKTGWEAEWEQTLKSAQKEGKVVLYAATPGPAAKAAVPFFKKKFGIDLEVLTGRGSEISNKLAAERKNGIYIADVFMTGMNSHFTVALPERWADLMEPQLILPEVKNPDNWFGGTLPWSDPEHRTLTG